MEVDEIEFQNQVSKFQRVSSNTSTTTTDNNNNRANLELQKLHDGGITGIGWPSSRIVRVSRASGGKDRHSKVLTSKGLRDRRVRLSVSTAIQFYDLQDRLGYDQPSKAVEWLLQAAASSIDELPSLDPPFPVAVTGGDNVSQAKSPACSSTSETSKGSGSSLSLSRSENRNKARERARVRVRVSNPVNNMTENSSFTDLLTGGININSNTTTAAGITSRSPIDYFFNQNHQFSFLQDSFAPAVTTTTTAGGGSGGGGGGSYNLNFAMTSSSTGGGPVAPGGYSRGTLQSNLQPSLLPHHHHHHHHLQSSAIDGSTSTNLPFFIGTNATVDHYPASGGYHINYSGDHHKEKSKN